jgi:hypothetical protein
LLYIKRLVEMKLLDTSDDVDRLLPIFVLAADGLYYENIMGRVNFILSGMFDDRHGLVELIQEKFLRMVNHQTTERVGSGKGAQFVTSPQSQIILTGVRAESDGQPLNANLSRAAALLDAKGLADLHKAKTRPVKLEHAEAVINFAVEVLPWLMLPELTVQHFQSGDSSWDVFRLGALHNSDQYMSLLRTHVENMVVIGMRNGLYDFDFYDAADYEQEKQAIIEQEINRVRLYMSSHPRHIPTTLRDLLEALSTEAFDTIPSGSQLHHNLFDSYLNFSDRSYLFHEYDQLNQIRHRIDAIRQRLARAVDNTPSAHHDLEGLKVLNQQVGGIDLSLDAIGVDMDDTPEMWESMYRDEPGLHHPMSHGSGLMVY